MLPEEAIDEFIEIYEKEYGERLEKAKAEELANQFFGFFKLIYRPIDVLNLNGDRGKI